MEYGRRRDHGRGVPSIWMAGIDVRVLLRISINYVGIGRGPLIETRPRARSVRGVVSIFLLRRCTLVRMTVKTKRNA